MATMSPAGSTFRLVAPNFTMNVVPTVAPSAGDKMRTDCDGAEDVLAQPVASNAAAAIVAIMLTRRVEAVMREKFCIK